MPAQLPESTKRALRIKDKTWQRLEWMAAEVGTTRAELVRSSLDHLTRHVKKPETPGAPQIRPSQTEWDEWKKVAEQRGTTVSALVREIMGKVCARLD